jgi:simple sugar transport system ATP-binding protein
MTAPVTTSVRVENVSKVFGVNVALDRVSMTIDRGTSLALAGRNGAGKSTLIAVITGMLNPTSGSVTIDATAASSGLGCVYQRSTLAPGLTASENIMLNNYPLALAGRIDWRKARRVGREMLAEWDCAQIADTPVERLAPVERKIVEICRALSRNPSVLLLDEPTAGLDYGSAQRLFARIRELQQKDVSVLYVSHHLEESFDVCDKTVVLRDGRVVMDRALKGLAVCDLVEAMVGDPQIALDRLTPAALPCAVAPPILRVDRISAGSGLQEASFDVRPGECIGLAGLEGAGHMTLAQSICGLKRPDVGTITVGGTPLRRHAVAESLKAGIGFIPEDRHDGGYVPALSVASDSENTARRVRLA